MKISRLGHNALMSFPWALCIGSLAACGNVPVQTQQQQIQTACQVASDADALIVAGTFSPAVKADAAVAMADIKPVCSNPNAQYSDVAITAMLDASAKLASDASGK